MADNSRPTGGPNPQSAPGPSSDPVSKLIFELSKLPGIGEKTATRLAYFILKQGEEYSTALSEAIRAAKRQIALCQKCQSFTDVQPCRICSDPRRDASILCVVEKPSDVLSLENAGAHRGLYHVLHGCLSPLDGIGPEELKIRELLARLRPASSEPAGDAGDRTSAPHVHEVVLATNPSVEGEATAIYLSRLLKPLGLRVTQLAHGLPVGGQLEYTDRQTLGRAMLNRIEIH
jgi:recombination protein RecR